MENWIKILFYLRTDQTPKEIIGKFHISKEHLNKYIQMFYDSNYIVLVYNSNYQIESYRITEKGISVLKANNLKTGGKKKHGKAPKNPKKATTSSQGNPEGNANSAKLPRNYR